jgi:hypothetical protein
MAMQDIPSGGLAAPTAQGAGSSGGSPGPNQDQSQPAKIPEAQAGYMELQGAVKDGDCSHVDVEGGVSLDRGCCNEFEPQDEQTDTFSCGNCKYGSEQGGNENENEGGGMEQGMAKDHPLQQLRAKPRGMGL